MQMIKKNLAMWLILVGIGLTTPIVFAEPSGEVNAPDEKMFKEKMEERRQKLFKDLNLTEAQQKALEENKKGHHEQMKAVYTEMKGKRTALKQELEQDKLNMEKIYQLQGELKKLQAQMSDQRLEGILEVRKILTLDQFKKFIGNMEKRHRGHFPSENKEESKNFPPSPPGESAEGGF